MKIFAVIILCFVIFVSSAACAKSGESPSPSPSPSPTLTPGISAAPVPPPSPTVSAAPLPTSRPSPTPFASPSITPETTSPSPAAQPSVSPQINTPRPTARDIEYYLTIAKARLAFGSNFKHPSRWPQDFFEHYISIVNKNMVELVYSRGDNELVYRVKYGSSNISGDFYVYEKVERVDIGGISAIIKSNADVAFLALWESENYSYSLRASKGLSVSEMEDVIASIK